MLGKPIPAKGNDAFAVNFVLGILDEVGHNRLILKSDNEPSKKALKLQVKGVSSKMDVILEESKTGDHQSNGLAKVAVRDKATKSLDEELTSGEAEV